MSRVVGILVFVCSGVAFVGFLMAGRMVKVGPVTTSTTTTGNVTMSQAYASIDVAWPLLLPLVGVAGVGLLLALWPRRPAGDMRNGTERQGG